MKLATAVSGRTTLTGEPVEPAHPQTAAALAAGTISTRAAGTVVATVDTIDDLVADDAGPLFETHLLEFAGEHDPETLGKYAHTMRIKLDQDGAYHDLQRAHRRREVTLQRRPDGSGTLSGELTCEAAEYLHTIFDVLAKPRPTPRPTLRPGSGTCAPPPSDATTDCSKPSNCSTPPASCRPPPTAAPPPWSCTPSSTSSPPAKASSRPPTATRSPTRSPSSGSNPKARAISCCCRRRKGSRRIRTSKGCSPSNSASPCSPATKAAPTGAAMHPSRGHKPTTSPITPSPDEPESTTAPCVHRQPRHLRTHGLEIDHPQRPTPLDPTTLGRPRTTTQTQPAPRLTHVTTGLKHALAAQAHLPARPAATSTDSTVRNFVPTGPESATRVPRYSLLAAP